MIAAVRLRKAPNVESNDGLAQVEGLELLVPDPARSALSRRLVERGVTELDFTDMARAVTRPGDVVLDVGASIGYFTILFATWVGPHGRVMAHEPWESARRYLLANVARNRLSNVTLDPRALADVDGDGSMSAPTYRLVLGPSSDPGAMAVSAVRFDTIAEASALARLDIVKMDIEGAEGRALAGMMATLRRLRPVLLLEVHPDMLPAHGHDLAGIHRVLDELGYAWMVVESDADEAAGHHIVAGPRERLEAAGVVPLEPRQAVAIPSADRWSVAPGSPAVIEPGVGEFAVRATDPAKPGYVVDGPHWWTRSPGAGAGAIRPSVPTWLTWDGHVPAGLAAQAWVFEYAGSSLVRRRAFALPDGPAEWRFLSGPTSVAMRLAIEVRGPGTLIRHRLTVDQRAP
ncbi:MAG: FkbM family methyltransferase [Chloroflexota bacterium]|nr:MAG: FkbM family methyltransferase [Chloroflexota bacterium]